MQHHTGKTWDISQNRFLEEATIPVTDAPDAYDWRDHDAVSEVKNQVSCQILTSYKKHYLLTFKVSKQILPLGFARQYTSQVFCLFNFWFQKCCICHKPLTLILLIMTIVVLTCY